MQIKCWFWILLLLSFSNMGNAQENTAVINAFSKLDNDHTLPLYENGVGSFTARRK